MFLGTILFTSLLASSVAGDHYAAEARYQSVLQRQCTEVLGFEEGSEQNMNCQLFYEKLFRRLYHISDLTNLSTVNRVEAKIEKLNTTCQNRYGDQTIPSDVLWNCIQQQGELERAESTYQERRQERRDLLRAIERRR